MRFYSANLPESTLNIIMSRQIGLIINGYMTQGDSFIDNMREQI